MTVTSFGNQMDCYGSAVVVRVELVGRLSLTAGDRRMNTARLGRNDRLALAFLILERSRQVSRAELAELIWEVGIPASWKTALRGIVSRIRTALATTELPAGALSTGAGWYELSLPDDTVVDVEAAERMLAAAADLLGEGQAERARVVAESALTIARGAFLAGVHGAWVEQRQELLDDLRLRALEVSTDAALRGADWAAARRSAEQALVLAPFRESVYRRLALAHTGCGDRGEALRVLTQCRHALAEELGSDVSPETEALSVGLLRGNPLSALIPRRVDAQPRQTRSSGSTGRRGASPIERWVDRSTPFVDRVAESAQLRSAWNRVADGSPELVVVVGEAGAGKTRLTAEFAAAVAQQGSAVLYGRCDEAASIGYGALTEALGGHVAGEVATAPNPAAFSEAVRGTLCRITSRAPALLILDDLQWLDRDTVAVLRYALRCPDPLPLLVAGGYRTGEPVSTTRLRSLLTVLRRERPVTRIDLAGLPSDGVADMVYACTGKAPDATLATAVVGATAGNPLFVRELTRLLVEEGRAGVVEGSLTLDRAGMLGVPEGVRQVILARCDRLTLAARRVLTVAAVCGPEVDVATLEATAELSTVDVLAALEEAVASHLMVERSAAPGRFAFVHGLVQETLYGELSAVRRHRLHADVAAAIEAGQGAAGTRPPLVAYHLLRGGPELAERATVAATRAGADALRRHAYEEAARHYAAALEVAGTNPSVRCRIRLELAGSRWRAGETATAREDYEDAAAEAYQANRLDLAARAVFGGAGHGPTLGRCDQRAAGQLTEVLRGLDARDPFRPRLLARLGAELAGAADPRAVDLCTEALEIAGALGDRSTVAYVLNCLNWVNLGVASDRSGLDRADRMIALADHIGDQHMRLEGRLWRCTYLLRAGRCDEAERETVAVEELAIQLRQPFYLRLPLRLRASLALLRGRCEEAAGLAAEAYTIERRVHPGDAEVHALLHSAAIGYASGRLPDVDRSLLDLPDAESPHWSVIRAVHLTMKGRVGPAARLVQSLLVDDAAGVRRGPLAAFSAALILRACVMDERLRARVDAGAAYAILQPWRGTHVVAGCAVASLGSVDACLDAFEQGPRPTREQQVQSG